MENTRIFIRDNTVYAAHRGALYAATDGNKFQCIGAVDVGVGWPGDMPHEIKRAMEKSVAHRPQHQRVELLVGGERVYGCWTEKEER